MTKLTVAFHKPANVPTKTCSNAPLSTPNPTHKAEAEIGTSAVKGRRLPTEPQHVPQQFRTWSATTNGRSEKFTGAGDKLAVPRLLYSLGALNIHVHDKLSNFINELPNSLSNSVEKSASREANKHRRKTSHLTDDYSTLPC